MSLKRLTLLIIPLIIFGFIPAMLEIQAAPLSKDLTVTSSYIDDVSNSNCLTAITSDGGTNFAIGKGIHLDAPFEILTGVESISSATLYYDSWGSISGSWGIYLKDSRDGNTIAYSDPAPEDSSETRNYINCNSLTPSQLLNGVWLYIQNNDNKKPESINLDYVYLSVNYIPSSSNSPPSVYLLTPLDDATIEDSTPEHTLYFIDMDDSTANCTLYYNGVEKGTYLDAQNNTQIKINASETPDGVYTWWINCSDGIDLVKSEERTITIDTSGPSTEKQAYYYPLSNIATGWDDGDSTSYSAIDDDINQPTVPSTSSDYLASIANDNVISEFSFPTITQEPNYLTLWVYTSTGSNAQYSFYLQQESVTKAFKDISLKTEAGWQNCTWSSPSGDYSSITIELGGCTKSGSGKPKLSNVYAAYLEVGYTSSTPNTTPEVYLVSPEGNYITNDNTPEHEFYFIDYDNETANCTLYYDGTIKGTYMNAQNNTITKITAAGSNDGVYNWWINCSDGFNENTSAARIISIDTQDPTIYYNSDTDSSGNTSKDWVLINISVIETGPAGIDSVTLKWNGINETFDSTDGTNYWENKTDFGTGNFTFRAFVNDRANNSGSTLERWVNISLPPVISIVNPAKNEYLPMGQTSVVLVIETDSNADCQYSTSDFSYGDGIDFSMGQGTTMHLTEFELDFGEEYTLYYRSKNIVTGVISYVSTVHTFGVYGCEVLTNSMRVIASENPDTSINSHAMYLLDNIPETSYTTSTAKAWSDTTTLDITFKLPDKTGYSTEDYHVSHFRFRCYDLSRSPDKYDVLADSQVILSGETITPYAVNEWVMIDVPDTDLTYAGGTLVWRIKSVQGSGSQKVGISDVEIFSTKKFKYTKQTQQTGFVGISQWWNNLQWAYDLHVDDVDNVGLAVNKFGSVMPLTLQIWRENTPNFGNVASIVSQGHEYGSHGYSHVSTAGYTYSQGRSWALNSKNFIESNVQNTSRWSGNTVLSLAYPMSDTNFHVASAAYDVGFRITGQINSQTGTGVTTCWRGWKNGNIIPRDELDWMHIYRSLGNAINTAGQFSDGTFETLWNYTRDNGYYGDAMIHQGETMSDKYKSHVENDTIGWQCTWGEGRSYYYYLHHTVLEYNTTTSNSNTKVYDVNINYESTQDAARYWQVPVTYGFNLTALGLNQQGVVTYLENTLGLTNIASSQSMEEGYFIEDGILYLSIIKTNGSKIVISDSA